MDVDSQYSTSSTSKAGGDDTLVVHGTVLESLNGLLRRGDPCRNTAVPTATFFFLLLV